MNEKEIMEYSQECGQEEAAGPLLLVGPDGFQGDYETYLILEKILNSYLIALGTLRGSESGSALYDNPDDFLHSNSLLRPDRLHPPTPEETPAMPGPA